MSIVVPEYEIDNSKNSFNEMFNYKSKLASMLPEEYLERYKRVYAKLREMQEKGKLPVHQNYLGDNELANSIYKKKYYMKDLRGGHIESKPEDVFVRLSAFVSAVEKDDKIAEEWAVKFYTDLYNSSYIPGGRVLAGAGDLYRLKTLANCFVSIIDNDNIESIYKTAYEAARTYSYGGGIGIDMSCLRPKGSVVHNAADNSTGAVSFMELYSLTTGLIGQSGRRGALMLTIDIKHPDIFDFIAVKSTPNWVTNKIIEQAKWSNMFNDEQVEKIKKVVMENTQVRFANISIKVSDEFMHALTEQNRYGRNAYLVYKKMNKNVLMDVYQDYENVHYSYGMPSKNIEEYELAGKFDSFEDLSDFLLGHYTKNILKEDVGDARKRDVYGDYIIKLEEEEYDLAIRQAGDFLLYFGSETTGSIKRLVKARDVWNKFVEGNYKAAEPGLIFWSKMSKYSPSNYVGRPIGSTNPCAEVPLEDGGACNLASMNLSSFVKRGYSDDAEVDWDCIKESVKNCVRFLDNVVSWNEQLNPLEKQKEAVRQTRRVGLGVMGIADMLNQLGIAYDSEEGIRIMERVMKFIANQAYKASASIAKEKGACPAFEYADYSKNPFFKEALDEDTHQKIKENGLRNIALISIAPTGTISNIAVGFKARDKNYIGVSSGIEPIFALYYLRRSESFDKVFKVFHPTVQAYLDFKGLENEVQDTNDEEELKQYLPEHFFRTAHAIEPLKRVRIQAVCQKYVDHSISSTVNLPQNIHPEIISNIYINAWKNGLKGITVYRDGSRYPVLSTGEGKTVFQQMSSKKFKIVVGEKEITATGSTIIVLPDQKLTTVYHFIKNKGENEVKP